VHRRQRCGNQKDLSPWDNEVPALAAHGSCSHDRCSFPRHAAAGFSTDHNLKPKQLPGFRLTAAARHSTITLGHLRNDRPGTRPVGSGEFGRSDLSVEDFAGQILEWTADIRPHHGSQFRMLRGTSWYHEDPVNFRVSACCFASENWQAAPTGIRCAFDGDRTPPAVARAEVKAASAAARNPVVTETNSALPIVSAASGGARHLNIHVPQVRHREHRPDVPEDQFVPVRRLVRGDDCVHWVGRFSGHELGDQSRWALLAVVSRDKKRAIAAGQGGPYSEFSIGTNTLFTCLHCDASATVPARGQTTVREVFWFLDGTCDDLLQRFHQEFLAEPKERHEQAQGFRGRHGRGP
jgi:hypothetical protein